MGVQVKPAYIGQTGFQHPVELDRNLIEGMFGRTGAVKLNDFLISQGVGTRAVAVAPGRYILVGTENAQQGAYFIWSDAIETFLLASVATSRIDSLILRAVDDQYGSISGSPRAELEVVQGVASGSPVPRSDSDFNVGGSFYKPGAWARLGDVRVNAADTGSIPPGQFTPKHRYALTPGNEVLCLSTDRPTGPDLFTGLRIYEIDTKFVRRYDGAVWRQVEPWRAEVVITGSASQPITFLGIPASLKRLKIDWNCRSAAAGTTNDLFMRVKNDSTSGRYGYTRLYQSHVTLSNLSDDNGTNAFPIGTITGTGGGTGVMSSGTVEITGWNAPFSTMSCRWHSGIYFPPGGVGNNYQQIGHGWTQTAITPPFDRIDFHMGGATNFVVGSQFTLEGWE